MSVTLDATVGGAGSNSYQDADGVQSILDGVRNTDAWDALATDSDSLDQIAVQATSLLDVLAYKARKTNFAQALAFPRFWLPDPDYGPCDDVEDWEIANPNVVYLDSTTIPKRMLKGHALLCLEIARAGGSDVWGVDETLNIKSERVDVLETTYADVSQRRIGLRKFPGVWTQILPLTRLARQQSVERA